MNRAVDRIDSDPPMRGAGASNPAHEAGALIVNADDWGRDRATTNRILECALRGAVSSVSAMVFMADSGRAATLAREHGIDTGLHLNLTTEFSGPEVPAALAEHQRRLARYLRRHRLSPAMFHPGLSGSFRTVVTAQIAEYRRRYGAEPNRIDGHHHMHLCANVLWAGLLPPHTAVRRNFSFRPGEKGRLNRLYRLAVDRILARRHRVTDFFFSMLPLDPAERLPRIFALARRFVVEMETHPINAPEYRYLTGGAMFDGLGDLSIARGYATTRPAPLKDMHR
jgi:chitin disaccharide deacetylase